MKSFPWFLTAAAVAAAAYILMNEPGPKYATGSDDVEDAARRVSKWGSRNRMGGLGSDVAGKVKEGVGRLTGNDDLAGEGAGQQVAGGLKDAAGAVAQAAGQTIHDLNR